MKFYFQNLNKYLYLILFLVQSYFQHQLKKNEVSTKSKYENTNFIFVNDVYIDFLNKNSLETNNTSTNLQKINIELTNDNLCFKENIDELDCIELDQFLFHDYFKSSLIPTDEISITSNNFKYIDISIEYYLPLIQKLIHPKYKEANCFSGIIRQSVSNHKKFRTQIFNNYEFYFKVIVLCDYKYEKEEFKLELFTKVMNEKYNKAYLSSSNFFSSFELKNNNIPIKILLYNEGNSEEVFNENYLVFKNDGIIIFDIKDKECKKSKYSFSYIQFFQCNPSIISEISNPYIKYSKERENIKQNVNVEQCFELIVDIPSSKFFRLTFCFEKNNDNKNISLLKKLIENSFTKYCTLSQAKYFKKLINDKKNKIKCINKPKSTLTDYDELKLLNLEYSLAIQEQNIRKWLVPQNYKDSILFMSINSKKIIIYLNQKNKFKSTEELLHKAIDIKNEEQSNHNLRVKFNNYTRKSKQSVNNQKKLKMTVGEDAEISINEDWKKRSSLDPNFTPVTEDEDCDGKIITRADAVKDWDLLLIRIIGKNQSYKEKNKVFNASKNNTKKIETEQIQEIYKENVDNKLNESKVIEQEKVIKRNNTKENEVKETKQNEIRQVIINNEDKIKNKNQNQIRKENKKLSNKIKSTPQNDTNKSFIQKQNYEKFSQDKKEIKEVKSYNEKNGFGDSNVKNGFDNLGGVFNIQNKNEVIKKEANSSKCEINIKAFKFNDNNKISKTKVYRREENNYNNNIQGNKKNISNSSSSFIINYFDKILIGKSCFTLKTIEKNLKKLENRISDDFSKDIGDSLKMSWHKNLENEKNSTKNLNVLYKITKNNNNLQALWGSLLLVKN